MAGRDSPRLSLPRTARILVTNLPREIDELDLERIFAAYGDLAQWQLKCPKRAVPFAIVRYKEPSCAVSAKNGEHGQERQGARIRIELLPEESPSAPRYSAVVSNLHPDLTKHELKLFFTKKKIDVTAVDIDRRGNGTVVFASCNELHHAIATLNDCELRGQCIALRVDHSNAPRLTQDRASLPRDATPLPPAQSRPRSPRGSSSQSRPRHRSRSRSRSRSRRPRSRSRSRSPRILNSRLRSHSRSRSPRTSRGRTNSRSESRMSPPRRAARRSRSRSRS